ncbi:MAG: RNA-directed DNA polymerase [Candidatus Andersenbacteria bacterium]|nr:RNA-directed DNA polymerase [Candidatus Andersenbacteria bacterium]MBI3251162.1 RNA-directed DNA polymerase [Candidatus Andersenbacteria bacterium]
MPIGNLTSQIFANIYMNEFDQFVKHELKVKHYARYTDDFVVIADSKMYLENLVLSIEEMLSKRLKLALHPDKIAMLPYHRGIDFLGYVIFPHFRLIRSRTKKRILRRLKQRMEQYEMGVLSKQSIYQSLQSYLGVLSHASAYKLARDIKNRFGFLS